LCHHRIKGHRREILIITVSLYGKSVELVARSKNKRDHMLSDNKREIKKS
jgi:hypothetical protein